MLISVAHYTMEVTQGTLLPQHLYALHTLFLSHSARSPWCPSVLARPPTGWSPVLSSSFVQVGSVTAAGGVTGEGGVRVGLGWATATDARGLAVRQMRARRTLLNGRR